MRMTALTTAAVLGDLPGVMTLLREIQAFLTEHEAHGQLVGDATEPGLSGYQVWISCPCGVEFRRWVTAGEAMIDLSELSKRH
jgi:hypothetical protein